MRSTTNPDAYEFHRPPNDAQHQFKGHHIISDQVGREELSVVWRELADVLKRQVPGDIVEFGCYAGTTSLFIRRLLDEQGESDRHAFHVYDSFEGLPEKGTPDQSAAGTDFQAGKLMVSKKEFLHQFKSAGLKPPIVHKGWFSQLRGDDLPNQIAFAFLDGDFYDSIRDSLALVWPRLAPHAVVLVDDYKRESLPGATQAVHNFLQGKHHGQLPYEHNIAIIRL